MRNSSRRRASAFSLIPAHHSRGDLTGAHRVEANALAKLERQRLRETDQRGFGRAVDGEALFTAFAGDRRHVDDSALCGNEPCNANLVNRKALRAFTAIMASQSAAVDSVNATRDDIPALLTRPSMRPLPSASAVSTARRQSASIPTSQATYVVPATLCSICAPASRSRPVNTTCAPSRARCSTQARPMPRVPPCNDDHPNLHYSRIPKICAIVWDQFIPRTGYYVRRARLCERGYRRQCR